MKISIALICLLSISGVLFASGPYTPPPAPQANTAQKKADKNNKKEDKNNKKDKDSKKGGQNS